MGMRSSGEFSFRLFLLIAFLVLGQTGLVAAKNADARSTGNWVVTGSETIIDVDEVWNGNITVLANGQLTITNSVLVFNSSSLVRYGITVDKGGMLVVSNSRLASVNSSEGFWFLAEGLLDVRNSIIESVFAGTSGLNWIGGFRITSDNPVIQNTLLNGSAGYFVRFEGCRNVLFSGNTITGASTALLLNRSTGVVKDNVFTNNSDRHIVIEACDGVDVLNNKLNDTGAGAFIVSGSRNIRSVGNYYEGGLYGVYTKAASLQMERDNITESLVNLEGVENSKVTLIDCLYDKTTINAKTGSVVTLKRVVRVRVIVGKNPVSGAIVTVQDSKKNQLAEATTDGDGRAQFTIIESVVTDNGISEGGPFTFKALKGLRSFSGRFATIGTDELDLKISLPWDLIVGAGAFLVLVLYAVSRPPKTKKSRRPRKA